jgi:RNA polymerase sigma-B factor
MARASTFMHPIASRPLACDGPSSETLFRRYQRDGDLAAREELVERFLPLARRLARRFSHSSEPYEDLVQVASLALVKAIDRFEPERGASFQAFAIPTILGELRRYFRDSGWAVHVPRGTQERALAVRNAAEHLLNRHGHSPTVQEIAVYLELSEEDVLDGLQAARGYAATSLDVSPRDGEEDGDLTVADTLGAEDDGYELVDAKVAVAAALRSLSEDEQRLLCLRFVEEMTQSEIGAELGVSQMQVSRLLRRTLAQLQVQVGAED